MTQYIYIYQFFLSEKILEYILVGGGSSKIKCNDMLIEIQTINEKKMHTNSFSIIFQNLTGRLLPKHDGGCALT